MNKEHEIKSLIKACVVCLRDIGYTERRIADYLSLWKNGIVRYMDQQAIANYNADVGESFINTALPDYCASQKRAYRRSMRVLTDYLMSGKVRLRIMPYSNYELSGSIGAVADEYVASLTAKRRSEITLNDLLLLFSKDIPHKRFKPEA